MQVLRQLLDIQPLKERLLKRDAEKHLPEHRGGFFHIHILPDFPVVFRSLDGGLPQPAVLLKYGGYLLFRIGIVQPHLYQQVVVVEIEAAIMRIAAAVEHAHDAGHGVFHSGYILVDKLRQRACRDVKLVLQLLGLEYVFIHHRHEQIELEGVIINQPGFLQSAGFGNLHLAGFLIIHPGEHPQRILQYFFSISKHRHLFLFQPRRYGFSVSKHLYAGVFLGKSAKSWDLFNGEISKCYDKKDGNDKTSQCYKETVGIMKLKVHIRYMLSFHIFTP